MFLLKVSCLIYSEKKSHKKICDRSDSNLIYIKFRLIFDFLKISKKVEKK